MFYWKNWGKKKTNGDEKYTEETSKLQDDNESADNSETWDTLRRDRIINTTKKGESLILRLMTMYFKYHVI